MAEQGPKAKFVLTNPAHRLKLRKTFTVNVVTATAGVDIDLGSKDLRPDFKWQLDAPVGKVADVRVTPGGFSVSKNWDTNMGSLSCNVELRGHCAWNRVTTISVDVVPQRAVTKAVTGGVAFFVGKTLDVNPRVKLGNLPVKLEVGASIYKEGAETGVDNDVLVFKVRSINALVNL